MIAPDPSHAVTALFVPGSRPDRFDRAAAAGAGLVIIDLEDSVEVSQKRAARQAALAALVAPDSGLRAAIRINSRTEGGELDREMVRRVQATAPGRLQAILLPKAETADDIAAVTDAVPGIPIIPIIESAAGLSAVDSLTRVPGVVRLAFGALDFGLDLNSTSPIMLDHARCRIVIASRLADLAQPLDSPSPEFRDLAGVSRAATAARALGFGGQLCIHPVQVPAVEEAFQVSAAELDWARRVMALSRDGVGQVDGSMVDRPVVDRARAILDRGR